MALGCVRVDLTVRLGRGVEGLSSKHRLCSYVLHFMYQSALNLLLDMYNHFFDAVLRWSIAERRLNI